MSGHSKWHNIQKTKGAQDAKRAAAFTKIAKELIVAVKEGGGITDPANNSRLATVITKAKAANMPFTSERVSEQLCWMSRANCSVSTRPVVTTRGWYFLSSSLSDCGFR